MGVDYYECDHCGLGYRDDSEYCAYCECGAKFCNPKCGKLTNYHIWKDDDENHPRYEAWSNGDNRTDPDKDITCICCRKEHFTDYMLLQVLLEYFEITYEQAEEIARKM